MNMPGGESVKKNEKMPSALGNGLPFYGFPLHSVFA
jgi:hypothetical protein